ncbi:hypothetical protein [Acidovorax sp.]|uniref:hypothetical protein n=1 Tax=Acidovorax sp. TaxID=1872122 RepID=UPI003D039586
MPKCVLDEVLQEQAKTVVEQFGGNVAAAASALSIDRTKFWRFVQSGKALTRTREEISAGVLRFVAKKATQQNETKQQTDTSLAPWTLEEAASIRSFCQKVIALIDFYEASITQGGGHQGSGSAPSA